MGNNITATRIRETFNKNVPNTTHTELLAGDFVSIHQDTPVKERKVANLVMESSDKQVIVLINDNPVLLSIDRCKPYQP